MLNRRDFMWGTATSHRVVCRPIVHEAKRATCLYPAWCLAIFLAHNLLELQQMASGIGLDAWSAIATFHRARIRMSEPSGHPRRQHAAAPRPERSALVH